MRTFQPPFSVQSIVSHARRRPKRKPPLAAEERDELAIALIDRIAFDQVLISTHRKLLSSGGDGGERHGNVPT
jgi:hypothetical protein